MSTVITGLYTIGGAPAPTTTTTPTTTAPAPAPAPTPTYDPAPTATAPPPLPGVQQYPAYAQPVYPSPYGAPVYSAPQGVYGDGSVKSLAITPDITALTNPGDATAKPLEQQQAANRANLIKVALVGAAIWFILSKTGR